MKSIEQLRASMSKRQKRNADRMYKKAMKGLDGPPIFCGPEARAMAEGPEALKAYYADCSEWLKPIDLASWN